MKGKKKGREGERVKKQSTIFYFKRRKNVEGEEGVEKKRGRVLKKMNKKGRELKR